MTANGMEAPYSCQPVCAEETMAGMGKLLVTCREEGCNKVTVCHTN